MVEALVESSMAGEASASSQPPPDVTTTRADLPATRAYQDEMLQESKHRNIIIALDTGSGKTLIAVQRIMHELEKESTKVCSSQTTLHLFLCYFFGGAVSDSGG